MGGEEGEVGVTMEGEVRVTMELLIGVFGYRLLMLPDKNVEEMEGNLEYLRKFSHKNVSFVSLTATFKTFCLVLEHQLFVSFGTQKTFLKSKNLNWPQKAHFWGVSFYQHIWKIPCCQTWVQTISRSTLDASQVLSNSISISD